MLADRVRAGCGSAAAILAVLLATACRPGEVPRSIPVARPLPGGGRPPEVRVGIAVDTSSVDVSSPTGLEVIAGGQGERWTSAAGEVWTVATDDGRVVARSGERAIESNHGLTFRPAGGTIRIGDAEYRGEATLITARSGVTAINVVDLEDYLLGVVTREIGRLPITDVEAVKAQAVAARTYAIGNRGNRSSLGFDFYAGVLDQVYGGTAAEDTVATVAVRETRGRIVTWQGNPILAYYSSTCGGQTAAIEESWPWRAPLPYLKSVSDRIPGTDDYYCSMSNRFRWSMTWTRAQLLETLGATLQSYLATAAWPVRRVEHADIESRTGSGRATLRLGVDNREIVLRADSVRWVLRTPTGSLLNSSRIDQIQAAVGPDGALDSLAVRGGGWGHGIGMCQVGAIGRARAGQKFDTILRTYYPGTEITRLY